MVMTGIKFMGHNPFSDVYIHGIVRDSKGRKMSKSLGNVIDPREIIRSCGTDALRMTLLTTLGGQDIYLGDERLAGMRNFANKLWNAGRFILMNLDEDSPADAEIPDFTDELVLDDRWILTELQKLIEEIDKNLTNYRFADAAQVLYDFTWHKFCDWYLELVKPRLRRDAEKDSARRVLLLVWERLLRLLHPFMPFITEELWQLLPCRFRDDGGTFMPPPAFGRGKPAPTVKGELARPQNRGSIMVSAWPRVCEELMDMEAVRLAERKYDVVRTGRQLRTEKSIAPGRKMRFIIKPVDEEEGCVLNSGISGVEVLLGASELRIDASAEVPENSLSGVSGSGTCVYMVADEVDVKSENERLRREIEKIEAGIELCEDRLSNSRFIERAPDDIIEKEKLKKREFEERRKRLMSHLA
jgi:valyl-tRNA synthetase